MLKFMFVKQLSNQVYNLSLLSMIVAGIFFGCDEVAEDQGPIAMTINFQVTVGDEPFRCGQTYRGVGIKESEVEFNDLRFYVHNVALIKPSGDTIVLDLDEDELWQRDQVALLDFEDGCENGNSPTNMSIRGEVPFGDYTGIRFTVGVPSELNSPETILEGRGSPLNLNAMYWSWRSGYKYLRLDTNLPFYRVHLGANACDDDFSCEEPNLAEFSFDSFNPETQVITFDLETLLMDSDLTENTEGTAPGCMGQGDDPDCAVLYPHFNLGGDGMPAFTVTSKQTKE